MREAVASVRCQISLRACVCVCMCNVGAVGVLLREIKKSRRFCLKCHYNRLLCFCDLAGDVVNKLTHSTGEQRSEIGIKPNSFITQNHACVKTTQFTMKNSLPFAYYKVTLRNDQNMNKIHTYRSYKNRICKKTKQKKDIHSPHLRIHS